MDFEVEKAKRIYPGKQNKKLSVSSNRKKDGTGKK